MAERIVFLNGDYLPESRASLPIFDRGLLFADAVMRDLVFLTDRL